MTKKEYSYINRVLQILIKYKIEKYQITYDEEGIHISLDQTMDEDIYIRENCFKDRNDKH